MMLSFAAPIQRQEDLLTFKQMGIKEVHLSCYGFARWPDFSSLEILYQLARGARALGLRAILIWDLLPTQKQWDDILPRLQNVPWSEFDAIRCQDYGVLQWLLEQTDRPVQWQAEVAHQNLPALKQVVTRVDTRLDRLIMNLELPQATLTSYARELKVEMEILGAGPLLLFYTPRPLLSAALKQDSEDLACLGSSDETPHRDFLLRQHRHGTLMYHPKDFFLLDKVEEVASTGVSWLRLDPRALKAEEQQCSWLELLQDFIQSPDNSKGEAVKARWPRPVMRGYFHQNRSDKLFVHLKNQQMQGRHQLMLGRIIDVIKKDCITLQLEREGAELKIGDNLTFVTPDGGNKTMQVKRFWSLSGEAVELARAGECVVLEHLGGISVKTQVFAQVQ